MIDWRYVKDLTMAWPIRFPARTKFSLHPTHFQKLAGYRVFWTDGKECPVTVRRALNRIEAFDWLGKRHQVRSIARAGVYGQFVIGNLSHCRCGSRHLQLLDGNHRVLAAHLARWHGPVILVMATP